MHLSKFAVIHRVSAAALALLPMAASAQQTPFFTPGNLVVVVEGCGVHAGTCTAVTGGTGDGTLHSSAGGYGDNQGAPMTLFQYTPNGTASVAFVNSLVLPQTASGANFPVSSEYGSSSEGGLQLSGNSGYLTLMGYGINATTFDLAYQPGFTKDLYGAAPSGALAQSGSLTGQSYTPVPRVVALIDSNGNVNSSSALYNIFNTNNPRSIVTVDQTSAWVSGQGAGSDATGGVFYIPQLGVANTSPIAITGLDTSAKMFSQDTRNLQILNNTLYVSVDTKGGSNSARDFIGTLGTPPATSLFNSNGGPTMLSGFGNTGGTWKISITTGPDRNGNNLNAGLPINLSSEYYFLANAQTLYVADTGSPKNDSNGDNSTSKTNIGNGGLEKWINSKADGSGSWSLAYTLFQGLNLVQNNAASGVTGLYGLVGTVNGNNVLMYATTYSIKDLDTTYLYGITDNLMFTKASQAAAETFTLLDTAPSDSNFKGLSFAPTIPTNSVEITSAPSGLTFTSAGTGCAVGTYTTPQTLIWTPGSSCTLSVATPQSGPTGVQYAFGQWEDGNASTTRTVTAPSTPAVYNASFTTDYLLTTSASSGGSVSPGGYFAFGTSASIAASPFNGFYFVNFTGSTTSTSNPLSLPMTAPASIMANFMTKTTPTITWNAPAAITYGSALSGIQLNATANVPGTFVYTPAAGTVLPVGTSEPLSVSFTPTDTVHNTTAMASNSITVNPAAPPASPANLVVTKVLSRSGGNMIVQLTIANTGGTSAANVMLASVKVGTTTATPLPQNIGAIAAGSSAQVTVSVPGTVGASGAASSLTISGTYTGGTFSSSARITLP